MAQENKDLLLKDLCPRLPYGVKVKISFIESPLTVLSINTNGETWVKGDKGYPFEIDWGNCKPYLFPLSSITEEQRKELSKLGAPYCEYALHDDTRGLGIMVDEAYIFFEFCYKHHIDFLGLIDMGLADDATNLNIY